MEDNALRVIFKIIKGSNRSLPSIELIQVAISILTNLARVRKVNFCDFV